MHGLRATFPGPGEAGSQRAERMELRVVRQRHAIVSASTTLLLVHSVPHPRVSHRSRSDQQHWIPRRLQLPRHRFSCIILLLSKLISLHKSLLDLFYFYVSERMHNFTTNVKLRMSEFRMSECRRYHRNSIASVRSDTTADQSQFHETYASPSV